LWGDYRAAQQSQLGFSLQSAINIHKGNKMSKKFWFMLFSLMLTSLSASALEVNCRWVNIEVSGEGGWRYECDTVPDLPPDDVINGTQPGGGGTATGGSNGAGNGIDMVAETTANKVRNTKELCKSSNPDHSRLATVTSTADSIDRTAAATAIYREDSVLQRAAVSSARRGIQLEFSVTFSDGGRQTFTVVAGSSVPVQESDKGRLVLGDGVPTGCPT
jgi:hypothetical protein